MWRSCRWETCRNLKQCVKQLPQRVICTCSRVLFCFSGNILFISQQYPSYSIANDVEIVCKISICILFLGTAPWFKSSLCCLCPITKETKEIRCWSEKLAVCFASWLWITPPSNLPVCSSQSVSIPLRLQSTSF